MATVETEVMNCRVCYDRCGLRSRSSDGRSMVEHEDQGEVLGRDRDGCWICAFLTALIVLTQILLLTLL